MTTDTTKQDDDAEYQRRLAEAVAHAAAHPRKPRESDEERRDRVLGEFKARRDELNGEADAAHAAVVPVPSEDTDRPATLKAVLAFMAEAGCCDECVCKVRALDAARVVERLRRGREAKNGGWQAGNPPYGWRSRGFGHLEPIRTEQLVLDWIFRQRAQGYGWENITNRLNEGGTPGPKGGRWYVSSVRRIVARGRDLPAGAQPDAIGQGAPET